MSKTYLDLADFTIASRSALRRNSHSASGDVSVRSGIEAQNAPAKGESVTIPDGALLQKCSPAERERRTRGDALAQEQARLNIRSLKRARQREVKFFVNVALDQATKARLKRAADENDLKMTVVMKAAIDFYLKENGY